MKPLTMTNDEAHDFLASQTKPQDVAKLGAAIRAIRVKARAEVKEEVRPVRDAYRRLAYGWHGEVHAREVSMESCPIPSCIKAVRLLSDNRSE